MGQNKAGPNRTKSEPMIDIYVWTKEKPDQKYMSLDVEIKSVLHKKKKKKSKKRRPKDIVGKCLVGRHHFNQNSFGLMSPIAQ
jgi:hypothetical protein